MAIPNILVSRSRRRSVATGLNDFRVFSLVGGTELRQVGSTVASVLETVSDSTHIRASYNRVIEFRGERYAYHRFQILAENEGGTGNWGEVADLSAVQGSADTYGRHTGLYKVQVNGVNTLIAIYQNVSNQIGAVRSSDGVTWTTVNPIIIGADGGAQLSRSIVFRNQLYTYADYVGGSVIRYNPQTDVGTLIDVPGTTFAPQHDFCVLGNNLYLVGTDGSTGGDPTKLYVLRGNAFEVIHTFTEVQNNASNERSCPTLFTDNTDLIAIIPGEDTVRAGVGDVALRIQNPGTGSQVVTDITTTLLPGIFVAPSGSQASETAHWSCFVNSDSDPLNPEIFLFRVNNLLNTASDQTVAAYQFTNVSTELTYLGNGLDFEIALPDVKFGGSERIYGGNKVYAELEGFTEVTGGIQFFYRVFGTGTDKVGTLYINGGEAIPATVATLTGSATGGSSVRSGNTITTITPDAGATLYSGVWAAGTDGFSETNNLHFQFNLV